jgi:hypothetical protein
MSKNKPNRNVTRAVTYDGDGNQTAAGWMVRFTRRGKNYQWFFGDYKHGGQRKALAAARLLRDEQEEKLAKLVETPVERRSRRYAGSATGVTGVTWAPKVILRGKKKYEYLFARAAWTDFDGNRCTKSFSTGKYGKKKAWDMAVEAHAKGIASVARQWRAQKKTAA